MPATDLPDLSSTFADHVLVKQERDGRERLAVYEHPPAPPRTPRRERAAPKSVAEMLRRRGEGRAPISEPDLGALLVRSTSKGPTQHAQATDVLRYVNDRGLRADVTLVSTGVSSTSPDERLDLRELVRLRQAGLRFVVAESIVRLAREPQALRGVRDFFSGGLALHLLDLGRPVDWPYVATFLATQAMVTETERKAMLRRMHAGRARRRVSSP